MVALKCYVDEHGVKRAEVSPPYELLGWYLMDDVQGGIYSCKELLSIIERVKNGAECEYSGTGNAHTVTITRNKVVIENEFLSSDDEMSRICEMPLIEYEKALRQWFEFILIGQEEQLEWVESMMKREAELPRIKEQRIKRKLMESKQKRTRKRGNQ